MPFINIITSASVNNKTKIFEEMTLLISSLTKKSKKFVMTKIEDNSKMYFEDEAPCCFLEIKSIGSIKPSKMAKPICDLVSELLGIPLDKIYISFEDFPASMWAWNGRTFG